MKNSILRALGHPCYAPSTFPQLLDSLKVTAQQEGLLKKALCELQRLGKIIRTSQNHYVLERDRDLILGKIQITPQGRGFVIPENSSSAEMEISAGKTGTALNGDRVLVRCHESGKNGRPPQQGKKNAPFATVVRVIERHRVQFVGSVERRNQDYFVVPDDPRIHREIFVGSPQNNRCQFKSGDKVVVQIRDWKSPNQSPKGVVTECLGKPDRKGVDMLCVLRQHNLPSKMPADVLREANGFGSKVPQEDLKDRVDCRDHMVVTIDPADAKDFDDAFSLQPAGRGRWKLWIHIADVSHYVKPGSALDREARKRGNSTYLVDRVIPMLPEELSNHLCSLVPRIDRLTKCVEFLLTDSGRVLKSRFYSAVIHSKRRYTYEEAMSVLSSPAIGSFAQMLHQANHLAQRIRQRRIQSGALNLDFAETKINLDEQGRVSSIEQVDYDASHQLIEELMLLANEAVASRLRKLKRPSIHRVHEKPEASRLGKFRAEVASHGIRCGNLEKPGEANQLFQRIKDVAVGPVLRIGFLKSLMKARYAAEPLGHYGLAKASYTHFTSPIRRYADLVVHRSLFDEQDTQLCMSDIAEHISATERNSNEAEVYSRNTKLFAFLQHQLRSREQEQYTALITGVRPNGLFVEVSKLGLRGMVPVSQLKDDAYQFDASKSELRGRRQGKALRLGGEIPVKVANVDTEVNRIDFCLVPERPHTRSPNRKPNGGRKRRTEPSAKVNGTAPDHSRSDRPQNRCRGKRRTLSREIR